MSLLTFFRNLYMKWVGIQNPPLTANCKKQFTFFAIWGMSTVIPFCFLQWFRVFPCPQPNDLGFCQWTSWQHAIHMTSKGGSMDCHAVTSQDDFILMPVIVFIVSLSFFFKKRFLALFCSLTCGLLLWYQLEACYWLSVLPLGMFFINKKGKEKLLLSAFLWFQRIVTVSQKSETRMAAWPNASLWVSGCVNNLLTNASQSLNSCGINRKYYRFSFVVKGEASFRLLLDWREGHYSCFLFDCFHTLFLVFFLWIS